MDFVAYSAAFNSHQNAIMHYGVRGMKWGVRKDAQLLAEHRRNQDLDKLKLDYAKDKYDKAGYRAKRKEIKKNMKTSIRSEKKSLRGIKEAELKKKFLKMRNKAMREVPDYKLKRGMLTTQRVMKRLAMAGSIGAGILSGGATLIATGELAAAAVMAAFVGGTSALGTGIHYNIHNRYRRAHT